jgi:hypothetical protein
LTLSPKWVQGFTSAKQRSTSVKSRQYYESLSIQQLIDAARYESREGRPQPELLAVLADMVEGLDDDCLIMQNEIDRLTRELKDKET